MSDPIAPPDSFPMKTWRQHGYPAGGIWMGDVYREEDRIGQRVTITDDRARVVITFPDGEQRNINPRGEFRLARPINDRALLAAEVLADVVANEDIDPEDRPALDQALTVLERYTGSSRRESHA
jgi:hypothetical protein